MSDIKKEEEIQEQLEGDDSEVSSTIGNIDKVYPNAEVRVEKTQYSILHLQNLFEKRKELVIDPDFQRYSVWNRQQRSELIESILMGIPIPLIYLFENKRGQRQVVDGKQRITAILDFLNNRFSLSSLNILKELNGLKFSSLDKKLQGVFEDYQLFLYIIQPPTPERIKYDIFDRVNRGGTPLNKQEMRNALYVGRATNLIGRLSSSAEFLDATNGGISKKRMKDKYVILRTIALLMLRGGVFEDVKDMDYRSDMDDFLARFMVYINETASDELIEKYENMFLKAMVNSLDIIGSDGFRFTGENAMKRPINMPLFETLTYFFTNSFREKDRVEIGERVEQLKIEFDKSGFFVNNVNSIKSIDYKFDRINSLINTFKADD